MRGKERGKGRRRETEGAALIVCCVGDRRPRKGNLN